MSFQCMETDVLQKYVGKMENDIVYSTDVATWWLSIDTLILPLYADNSELVPAADVSKHLYIYTTEATDLVYLGQSSSV